MGGSEHYRGAPLLSALGALKAAVEVVIVASTDDVCREGSPFAGSCFHPMKRENPQDLLCWSERGTAAVVGPGLGRDSHGASRLNVYGMNGAILYWLMAMASFGLMN